jgi:hypothetical protein
MPTANVEATPTIEAGLKGTLPPQEYSTKTMPSWGQVYLPSIAKYGDMDYVSIAFATDADKAAALIPKELQLVKIPFRGSLRRTWFSPSIVSAISDHIWR